MSPLVITLIVVAVLIGILVALYFVGNRMQKKQLAQKEEMQAAAQQTSMLIIDKKMMKLKDAGLPKVVMDQTPKRFRNAKMPIVKAKVGPQTLNLICDDGIFDDLPTKCEVKAMVSGIYITEIKSVRGKKKNTAEEPKKKSFGAKMRKKQRELQNEYAKEEKEKEARKAAKAEEKKKAAQAKKITK
ncbi:MAG: hypothetical protein PUC55_04615 [Lachnospiraceae bacterium]|nr:hypothetical protein [Lachnospiraceae bacterium]HCJ08527.1 hypothetical protein [Lachnospiraceae bacterium]